MQWLTWEQHQYMPGKITSHHLPNDTISLPEAIHATTDLKHFTSDITAKDGGPLLNEDASVLHMRVERIDGDGGVLHNNFPSAGFG